MMLTRGIDRYPIPDLGMIVDVRVVFERRGLDCVYRTLRPVSVTTWSRMRGTEAAPPPCGRITAYAQDGDAILFYPAPDTEEEVSVTYYPHSRTI